MRLPANHCAGQGAGDAVHELDAGDHQPAQLIQTGRLDPGDDVVGAGEVLGRLHTIQIVDRLGDMGDLADLGLDKHVCAKGSLHDNLDVPGSSRPGEWYSTWPTSQAGTPKHPALTSSALDLVTLA